MPKLIKNEKFSLSKESINEMRLKRQRKRGKVALFFQVVGLCVAFGILGIGAYAVWTIRDLPRTTDDFLVNEMPQSIKIYDRNSILLSQVGDERRTIISLTDMSKYLPLATIAVEDATFYKHPGINIKSTIRAILTDIFTGTRGQGGSTITQQLVKNLLLTNEKSISRKIKEAVLAIEVERIYTKDEILYMYLNAIPEGSDIYGVQEASLAYFKKDAKDLTLAEAALLAALPQSPSYYFKHQDDLKVRQEYVLDRMVKNNFITQEEADAAKKINVLSELSSPVHVATKAYQFVDWVKDLLTSQYGINIDVGGYNVYTTLDWTLQQKAEAVMTKWGENNAKKYNTDNGALVSLDPTNGQVLAMVGSLTSINVITGAGSSSQSPGSSFKPIVYATAFLQGYTPDTVLWDVPTRLDGSNPNPWPKNFDGTTRGPVTMKQALAQSLNIPAVETAYLTGVSNIVNQAEKMGITFANSDSAGLSIAIGGAEITRLIDLAGAFSVFAAGGMRYPINPILQIKDSQGNIIDDFTRPEGQQVLDTAIADQINAILSNNSLRAPVFGKKNYLNLGNWAAAKTGTSTDSSGKYARDVLTIGYTHDLTTLVWFGRNDDTALKGNADGSNVAAPSWNEYMKFATTGRSHAAFPSLKATNTTKPILNGILPAVHTTLYWINKSDPQGVVPTAAQRDPQYTTWENAVQSWVATHPVFSVQFETNKNTSGVYSPKITVQSPVSGTAITDSLTITVQATASPGLKISEIDVSVNDASTPIAQKQITQEADGNLYTFVIDKSFLPQSQAFSIAVKAVDNAGNVGLNSITDLTIVSSSQGYPFIDTTPSTGYSYGY